MHPVNTFHSLVRISIWLPRLVKLPPKYLQTLANPMKIEQQAASGLANVQDFHDLDITNLAVDGTFQDPITKEVFKAATNMTPHELFVVTKTVVQLDDFETLDNNIAWAQAAFDMAKSKKDLKSYKTLLKLANSTYRRFINSLTG